MIDIYILKYFNIYRNVKKKLTHTRAPVHTHIKERGRNREEGGIRSSLKYTIKLYYRNSYAMKKHLVKCTPYLISIFCDSSQK